MLAEVLPVLITEYKKPHRVEVYGYDPELDQAVADSIASSVHGL